MLVHTKWQHKVLVHTKCVSVTQSITHLAGVDGIVSVTQSVSDLTRKHRVEKTLTLAPLDVQALQVPRDLVTTSPLL